MVNALTGTGLVAREPDAAAEGAAEVAYDPAVGWLLLVGGRTLALAAGRVTKIAKAQLLARGVFV